jgi:hypothetical protein
MKTKVEKQSGWVGRGGEYIVSSEAEELGVGGSSCTKIQDIGLEKGFLKGRKMKTTNNFLIYSRFLKVNVESEGNSSFAFVSQKLIG